MLLCLIKSRVLVPVSYVVGWVCCGQYVSYMWDLTLSFCLKIPITSCALLLGHLIISIYSSRQILQTPGWDIRILVLALLMYIVFHQSTIRYCDKEGNKTLFSEVQADIDCTQVIPRKRGDKDYNVSNCIVISSWIIRRCRDFIYNYTTSRKEK